MPNIQYIVPLTVTPESNETLVAKKTIRVLDCSTEGIGVNELCNLWNFNHCPTDKDYCNPFVPGDKIFQQLVLPEGYFSYTFYSVINVATGLEITLPDPFVTVENGSDVNIRNYTNFIIDTTQFTNIKCFYIKILAYKCKLTGGDLADFNACVEELMEEEGKTLQEAQRICLAAFCDDADSIYSEPYCLENCLTTIVVEGFYPGYDCNGNFYGKFTTGSATNSFKPQIRIKGEVAPTQFDIEEVVTNKKRKSTTLMETFNFNSKRLPYYVIQKIATIFASQLIYVDGVEYSRALNISKNIEDGMMWAISSTLVQECDTINFTCD